MPAYNFSWARALNHRQGRALQEGRKSHGNRRTEECTHMKGLGLVGLLITAAIGVGIYMYTLKLAAPAPGMVVTQNISVVGVKNDLMAIAQAERMYYTQNGSYADLPTLTSAGTMNITRTSRDG